MANKLIFSLTLPVRIPQALQETFDNAFKTLPEEQILGGHEKDPTRGRLLGAGKSFRNLPRKLAREGWLCLHAFKTTDGVRPTKLVFIFVQADRKLLTEDKAGRQAFEAISRNSGWDMINYPHNPDGEWVVSMRNLVHLPETVKVLDEVTKQKVEKLRNWRGKYPKGIIPQRVLA